MNFVSPIATAITAFAATNIDDIVILMLFFAQTKAIRPQQIVLGQYLGFIALILLSLPGFFGGQVVPTEWIGLLGILPIVLGIRALFDRPEEVQAVSLAGAGLASGFLSAQTYQVAVVTFANGGDNVGIYVPLFASCDRLELGITIVTFLLLVGVWCGIAQFLAHHPKVAPLLTGYAHRIVPFVLIGLGLFILLENNTYDLLSSSKSLLSRGM